MQIVLPDELKKWCYYDVKKFSYQIQENAPEDIKKRFEEYKERSLEMFNVKKEWEEYHNKE